MKAITVKQPWASLIVEGIKDIENRTWKCPQKYIGQRVLIHSSQKHLRPVKLFNDSQKDAIKKSGLWSTCVFPECGAIIGSVEIIDCVQNHSSIWAEKTEVEPKKDDFIWIDRLSGASTFDGDSYDMALKKFELSKPIYNWIFANPIKYTEPIPCKGKLSFWEYKREIL